MQCRWAFWGNESEKRQTAIKTILVQVKLHLKKPCSAGLLFFLPFRKVELYYFRKNSLNMFTNKGNRKSVKSDKKIP